MEFWRMLFSSEGFVARRFCGAWTESLIRLHEMGDAAITVAYLLIAILLWRVFRLWQDKRLRADRLAPYLPRITGLMIAVFLLCAGTHANNVLVFYRPLYRWFGVWTFTTGLVSGVTCLYLLLLLTLLSEPRVRPAGGPA